MAIIDKINRRGTDGKQAIVGPAQLRGPKSGDTKSDYSRLSGIYGSVDQYEINNSGNGTDPGAYTVRIRPYSEAGFHASHRAVGNIAVLQQVNGVADPTAAVTCLGRKRPADSRSVAALGPFSVGSGDRLWVVVEHTDYSTLKYQLELNLDLITISAQPPNRSVTAPAATTFTVTASTNDGGSLSYQWQLSTNGGTSYTNITNGGVYSGATTATLSISNSTGLNANRYRVIVSSNGGAPSRTSNAGILTVT